MENNVQSKKNISFFKLVKANLLLIILTTLLVSLLGALLGVLYIKPEYKVSRSAILRTELESSSLEAETNNASLAFLVIGQLEYYFTAADYIDLANHKYEEKNGKSEDKIIASNIDVEYKEDSLIFTISYKDSNKAIATKKLKAVFEASVDYFSDHATPYNIKLIPTDNAETDSSRFAVSENHGITECVVIGLLAGIIIAFAVVLIKTSLDNTVHDKDELEEITGVSMLACISKR